MVSKSSYNELMLAYEQRGALLFEAVHLLTQVVKIAQSHPEEIDEFEEQIEEFLSRARLAGMA